MHTLTLFDNSSDGAAQYTSYSQFENGTDERMCETML